MVLDVQRYAKRFVFILGLIATAWFVWANSIGPGMGRLPLSLLIGRALLRVLLAIVSAGAIALCVYLTVSWTSRARSQSPLGSGAAAWYVPAMILTSALAPLPIAAGGFLVFTTTRLMVAGWEPSLPPLPGFDRVLFWRRLGVALACSITIHMGLLALARGSPQLAIALFAAILATLTSLAIVVGACAPAKQRGLSHSFVSLLLMVLLTIGVTISKRGGNGDAADQAAGGNGAVTNTSFPGVILLRELEKNAVLIAPSLKRESRENGTGLPGARRPTELKQPLDITFSGEYWMFLPFYRRPPPKSLIRRGNPAELSFRTDGGPMTMEAHQLLSESIDPASCDKIQVVVLGPDMRRALALELYLVDTEALDPLASERLGRRFVRGVPSEDTRDTLVFSFPAVPRLKRFNEIKIAIWQPGPMNKSVKIEVERMTILPR